MENLPVAGKCPLCDSIIIETSKHVIRDGAGRWEEEAFRLRCNGGHVLFVCDSKRIKMCERPASDGVKLGDAITGAVHMSFGPGTDPVVLAKMLEPGMLVMIPGIDDEKDEHSC